MARGFTFAPGASDEFSEARLENLQRDRLLELAQSRNSAVRAAIAGRDDCPLGVIVTLAIDGSADVRAAVAGNPIAQRTVLAFLSEDRSTEVLSALLTNPSLPADLIGDLALHRKSEVRAAAAARLDAAPSFPQEDVREDSHIPEVAEQVAPLPMAAAGPVAEAEIVYSGRMSPAPSGMHESAPAAGTDVAMPPMAQILGADSAPHVRTAAVLRYQATR